MSVSSIKSGGSESVSQPHVVRGMRGLSHLFFSPHGEKVDFQFLHQVRYDLLKDLLLHLPKDYKNHRLLTINLKGSRITDRDLAQILSTEFIHGTSRFSNLLELNLSGCRNLTTLAPLRYVPRLRQLSISHYSNWSSEEYDAFQSLTKLEELDLSHSETLSNEGLAKILSYCPHLKTLRLSGCKNLTEDAITSIAKLSHLEHLDLSGCAVANGVLSHLENHPSLNTLHLRRCSLTDLDLNAIRKIPNLRDLDLSGNTFITKIHQLGQLTSLKIADCFFISNLIELHNYRYLRTLDLSGLTIGPVLPEIAPFLSELRSLSLSNCQLQTVDCESLLKFSHLHFLDLSRNPQVDDKVVKHLRKLPLTTLDISHCKIQLFFEQIGAYCRDLKHLKLYEYWRSFYYPPPEPPKVQEHRVITFLRETMKKPLAQRVAAVAGAIFITVLYL